MSGRPGPGLAELAGLAAVCLQAAVAQPPEVPPPCAPPPYAPPMERFVTNRPRLFISAAALPSMTQAIARTHRERLAGMRTQVNALAAATHLPPGDYGVESAVSALVFLCERTPERLSVATGLLDRSVSHYRNCDRSGQTVGHYSATRIHAIVAYDWLYDAMPVDTRRRLGRELLAHVERRVTPPRVAAGDNLGDFTSGFYGELSLPWYVGIATLGTGIDEDKSAMAIAFGYEKQVRLLEHRRRLAGDDGGDATATLGYALRADPWAEFNFFHTMKSAFGLDIAGDWPHLALFPSYALWNRLPGNLEFGAGDAFHFSNAMPDEHLYTHLAQIRHFFSRSHPEPAALAVWLQSRCRPTGYHTAWPLTPFLLAEPDHAPPPREPDWNSMPPARHFAGMGQIFMRSGWGADDTYALFTAGGQYDWHKHFDENTFVIFHRGFLAPDSGTRPEPGSHLFQYYCRTVAHNGVLIRMEGETFPPYWGAPASGETVLPIANDGGMRSPTGAVIHAFRATPDYTYIASDATACYHPGKCRLALRQFLHVQPNLFVVFDRVVSVKPEFRKSWLLHTAREPRLRNEQTFSADHGEGRLFCRTLLPSNAVVMKIGGPGREFWNDGWNWPLPTAWQAEGSLDKASSETMGTWRVEVSPAAPAQDDRFLHLIEAGDRAAMTNMSPARLLDDETWSGVEVSSPRGAVIVQFRKRGEAGCRIRIRGGAKDVDESPANTVQPQTAWAASLPKTATNRPAPPPDLRRTLPSKSESTSSAP